MFQNDYSFDRILYKDFTKINCLIIVISGNIICLKPKNPQKRWCNNIYEDNILLKRIKIY